MNITTTTPCPATDALKRIVVRSSCALFAEADDLIELKLGGFDGDGIYALEYVRAPGCANWSGLRRVRSHCGQLQVQEHAGDWVAVNDAVRFSGKVFRVMKPRDRHTFMPELAA